MTSTTKLTRETVELNLMRLTKQELAGLVILYREKIDELNDKYAEVKDRDLGVIADLCIDEVRNCAIVDWDGLSSRSECVDAIKKLLEESL
jgi:hypothetical protein